MKVTNWKTIATWLDNFAEAPQDQKLAVMAAFDAALPVETSWDDPATITAIHNTLRNHSGLMHPFTHVATLSRFRLIMIALKANPGAAKYIPLGFLTVKWGTVPPTFHAYVDAQATVSRFVERYPEHCRKRDRALALAEERRIANAAQKQAPVQQELPLQQPDLVSLALTVTGLRKEVTTQAQQIAGSYKRESSQNLKIEEALRRIAWLEEQWGGRDPRSAHPLP